MLLTVSGFGGTVRAGESEAFSEGIPFALSLGEPEPSVTPALSSSRRATDDMGERGGEVGPSGALRLWHVDLGLRVGFPRLAETQSLLAHKLDLPLKFDLPGAFQRPRTPIDQRDELALDAAQIGFGRKMNDWLRLSFHLGGMLGDQRKSQRTFNLALKTDFPYLLLYADLTAEIYPWGIPEERARASLWERFRASRPFIVTGFETAYVQASADGQLKFQPLALYKDDVCVRDWLVDYLLGVGWELPLTPRWSFDLSGYYSFHFYRAAEYSGWNILAALRYRF
jgi:hypothetical protein